MSVESVNFRNSGLLLSSGECYFVKLRLDLNLELLNLVFSCSLLSSYFCESLLKCRESSSEVFIVSIAVSKFYRICGEVLVGFFDKLLIAANLVIVLVN